MGNNVNLSSSGLHRNSEAVTLQVRHSVMDNSVLAGGNHIIAILVLRKLLGTNVELGLVELVHPVSKEADSGFSASVGHLKLSNKITPVELTLSCTSIDVVGVGH